MTAIIDKKGSTMSIDLRSPALNWINEWLDSAQHTESINPATGKVIGTYADDRREESVQAFRELNWKDNRALWARVLNQIADCFEANTVWLQAFGLAM